jgi:hypothetical protein
MLTPTTPLATPFPIEATNTVKPATVDANARAAVQAQLKAGTANEARVADVAAAQTTAQRAATAIPDPMASLSTVAVAGAMHSLPAALGMLQRIVLASASGTLSDADRQNLQSEHAQLTAKVVSSVGSVGAGEQAQTSTAHEGRHDDNAGASGREHGNDQRMPATPSLEARKEALPHKPVEQAPQHQHDAPAPVSHAETRPSLAAQAAQVTQFVQVAQPEHAAPKVRIA